MANILIYEPDRTYAEQSREDMRRIFTEIRCNLQMFTHTTAESSLTKLMQNPHLVDIAILNYEHKGNVLAEHIRNESLSAALIFTGTGEIPPGSLIFRPSGYLRTPVEFDLLKSLIVRLLEEQALRNRSFLIRTKEKLVRIAYGDIDCIESAGRNCSVLTASGLGGCTFIAKLDDVRAMLPENIFVRCHQSCIVNISNATAIDRITHRFAMRSGRFVDISKRNYSQIAEMFEGRL